MNYTVMKPFGWDGRTLEAGETVDIEPGSKADALVRAKFIRPPNGEPTTPAPIVTKPTEAVTPTPNDGSVVVYCVKCKIKRPLRDAQIVTLSHGRKAMQGKCETCGTKLHRMKKKAE
jgi:hypothetical protein